jgi:hypothetical protein
MLTNMLCETPIPSQQLRIRIRICIRIRRRRACWTRWAATSCLSCTPCRPTSCQIWRGRGRERKGGGPRASSPRLTSRRGAHRITAISARPYAPPPPHPALPLQRAPPSHAATASYRGRVPLSFLCAPFFLSATASCPRHGTRLTARRPRLSPTRPPHVARGAAAGGLPRQRRHAGSPAGGRGAPAAERLARRAGARGRTVGACD